MAALPELTPLAHGGTAGAIGEAALALGVAGVFIAVWLRERRRERCPAEFRDEDSDENWDDESE